MHKFIIYQVIPWLKYIVDGYGCVLRLYYDNGGNMKLRKYQKEDAAIICSWIKDEKSLYQWSADRIGKFPLAENDLNEEYVHMAGCGRFFPVCALDDKGGLMGHLFIRYPDGNNNSIVRFGFIIADPVLRGFGNGKKMLLLAIDYAKNILCASKVTLGVFTNNDNARFCYEAVGFKPVGITEIYKMPIGEWECIEMELVIV